MKGGDVCKNHPGVNCEDLVTDWMPGSKERNLTVYRTPSKEARVRMTQRGMASEQVQTGTTNQTSEPPASHGQRLVQQGSRPKAEESRPPLDPPQEKGVSGLNPA